VALDLEHDREPVAGVHRTRVFAGAHQYARALRGQLPQQLLRMLVAAVLAPEQREHRQLQLVRLPAQELDDALVLGSSQSQALGLGDLGHAGTAERWLASDSNSRRPSVEPVSSSTACSACGLQAETVSRSVYTPRD